MQEESSYLVPEAVSTAAMENDQVVAHAKERGRDISVLGAVFRAIFVEGPKKFFGGIFHFFRRYFRHYGDSIKFLNWPSLKVAPFNDKDFKESSMLSFEVALLFSAALIFMIKQDWIPVHKELQDHYNNDLMEIYYQLVIFIIFAVAYFGQILLTVLTGRLLRVMFKIPVTRTESDILFAYLNNTFFSLSALMAFLIRCSMQYEEIKNAEGTINGITMFCLLLTFGLITWWSVNFARLNKLSIWRRLFFYLFSIALYTLMLGICMGAVIFFILGT